jgi:hypothetical protein
MTQLTEVLGRLRSGDAQARDAMRESYLRFVNAGELRAERPLDFAERAVQRDWDKTWLILAEGLR